jgi:hypothetical protein
VDHLDPIRNRIMSAPVLPPPKPWKCVGGGAVGGLTEVGFADGSDLLLVVSAQGRGVFDCRSGERVARDCTEPNDGWYDERRLLALGIGPLDGQFIRLAGLGGGGLIRLGCDGWWIETITLVWPDVNLLLGGPWGWIHDGVTPFTKLQTIREFRAFGFSETGQSLVIATSSDLLIYSRQP